MVERIWQSYLISTWRFSASIFAGLWNSHCFLEKQFFSTPHVAPSSGFFNLGSEYVMGCWKRNWCWEPDIEQTCCYPEGWWSTTACLSIAGFSQILGDFQDVNCGLYPMILSLQSFIRKELQNWRTLCLLKMHSLLFGQNWWVQRRPLWWLFDVLVMTNVIIRGQAIIIQCLRDDQISVGDFSEASEGASFVSVSQTERKRQVLQMLNLINSTKVVPQCKQQGNVIFNYKLILIQTGYGTFSNIHRQ